MSVNYSECSDASYGYRTCSLGVGQRSPSALRVAASQPLTKSQLLLSCLIDIGMNVMKRKQDNWGQTSSVTDVRVKQSVGN
jgi:hypothetical protein